MPTKPAALKKEKRTEKSCLLKNSLRNIEHNINVLCAKMDGLRPLLSVYGGEDLYRLRRKLRTYYEMACECRHIATILESYYDEEDGV